VASQQFSNYAARLGFPDSDTMLEILELLFPEGAARSVFEALVKPATLDEIILATALSREQVEKATSYLHRTGAIARYMEPQDKFKLFGAMIELRDATAVDPDAPNRLFHLWERLITEDLKKAIPAWKQANFPELLRTVPIEEAVPAQNLILDIDSARQIIRQAEIITASTCPCRTQAQHVGKGDKCPAPKEVDLCLQINKFAYHFVQRGIGEQISQQEALRRIGMAEDAGLVHQVRNNIKKDMMMCNCCSCCCTGLYMTQKLNYAVYAKSRFQVSLEAATCNGCGKCVKRCQFKALTLDRSRPKSERSVEIDLDKCHGCGNCVVSCPTQALSLKEVRPREWVRST
jgi:ferredoxin